jgi:membrane protein DedA with SNARE-associated domain/rhodanese-related sulfurtransferase
VPHSFAPLYSQLGLGLAVGNVLLEQIGLPIPAVPTLVVAGAVAAEHYGWGTELFVAATLACVLPDAAWYVAGRRYGSRVLKLLCYLSLTPDSCVSDTQQRFARWGGNALVVAKFVPGLATIAPPMAGALQMGWPRFLGRSMLGAALWVGAYLSLGMLFHEQIDRLFPRVANLGGTAIAVIAALLAGYIAFKWWERRRFYATLRMARISASELYDQMGAERAPLVVDVRSHSARAMEPQWIPGALHVPPDELNVHLGELPRDREIVLYCNCPNEASAAQAAKLLMNHGFTRVRPLHGGLDAWVAAGYAVATAPPGEVDSRAA